MKSYYPYGLIVVAFITGQASTVLASPVQQDQNRGALILEKQLQKAQYLRELEYQAEVLERQARIAKAQENIDKTVGYTPVAQAQNSQKLQPRAAAVPLPKVVALTHNAATFQFADGAIQEFRLGEQLPTGYLLKSVSMSQGALLSRDGKSIRINYQW